MLAAYGQGLLAQVRGDWPAARARYVAARTGFAGLGTPVPEGLCVLGVARCDEGEGRLDAARDGYREASAIAVSVGEPGLSASAEEGLGRVAALQGELHDAETHFAAVEGIRHRGARPAPPHEARDLAAGRALLDSR